MENIIKKAIEGGYTKAENLTPRGNPEMFTLDPLFWQSLGKACGWDYDKKVKMTVPKRYGYRYGKKVEYKETERKRIYKISSSKKYALRFHEINLTQGWDKAVEWLGEIIK